jgi:AraC-like DNA-binding protein
MQDVAVRMHNLLTAVPAMSDDLTFLATTCAPRCTTRLDKYLDGYYTVQFLSEGALELAYDDRWTMLAGGQWFWPAYPGPRLRFHPAPGCAYWFHRHVGFRGPLVQRWIGEGLWPEEAQPAPAGRDWPAFFDRLIAEVRRGDRWGRLRATCLLEEILVDLAEARAGGFERQRPAWLEAVLAVLERDGVFAPSYETVAATAGMGVSTLRRRFKEEMGVTLHEYVIRGRIGRARTLLAETDLPLRAVAERLGYESEYFFSRQFRQHAGVAPGVFRRSRQG